MLLIGLLFTCFFYTRLDGSKLFPLSSFSGSRLSLKIYRVVEDFIQSFYHFLQSIYFCFLRQAHAIQFLYKDCFIFRFHLFDSEIVPEKSNSIYRRSNFRTSTSDFKPAFIFIQTRPFCGGPQLTHVNERGKAAMVNVSKKPVTSRHAVASGRVWLNEQAFRAVQNNAVAKGDVLTVAQIAGILAAKKCSDLIPLCHSLSLTNVDVQLSLNSELKSVDIEANASTADRTGVEMESLTAVAVTALTIYDMCKALGKDAVIGDIKLQQKSGGVSGDYRRFFKE